MAEHNQIHHTAFSEHLFEYRAVTRKKLILSLVITASVMVIELIGGIYVHSIALISDAGHMFTHCFALSISLHRTFGLYRAEILAAFINGLSLLLMVAVIIYEAIVRVLHPEHILSLYMLVIGLVGLGVNVASIFILRGTHEHDLNVKGVFYHMVADAASSVGVIAAALVIQFTGWTIIDPVVSLGISAVILVWSWNILRESATILLEMAPTGLNVDIIVDDLKSKFPEIKMLTSVHLWTITANMLVFSAHVKFDESVKVCADHNQLISRINSYLRSKYAIIESTLQIFGEEEDEVCELPQ
jgi:cobalt-zinc-cadmium efflux system protein